MATAKFTVKRGQVGMKDVAVAAGTAEAQTDTVSINVDYTAMRKGDVVVLLETAIQKIQSGKWPPL